MAVISFSSTYLSNKNKKGISTPDSDGYYELVVGGLNMHNSMGHYYVSEGVTDLFNNPSFQRRVQNGALKGEVGHPFNDGRMSNEQFLDRFLTIRETNVCCHHAKVWLDTDSVKTANGQSVIAIMAKVKPTGAQARVLEDSLQDPNQNTAFSVRGFTADKTVNGVRQRILKTIITFDYVIEPGLSVANQWDSPALESLHESPVDKRDLVKLENTIAATHLATESSLLLKEIQWIKDEDVCEKPKTHTPFYVKW